MSARELPKAYEPHTYEDAIYTRWEKGGFFAPESIPEWVKDDAKRESFSMVLPPPNVTGTLHMGHAVMLAVQDVMARYHRMKGDRTVWIPGTDHAAVATESKVEKMLIEGGMKKPKTELGREKFLEHVEKFASESHDTIVNQAKKMGASLDWSREAFTLDKSRNTAVNTLFKMMYDDGLIYRGYRVINWSVKGQSTCSDDELVHVERPGKLYYFTYGPECPITIATTRPETKLGDTAIAVHPKGKWKKYIGKEFTITNFGQTGHILKLKVIGDEGVDDTFGTGALGVTPAHSQTDFEIYQKNKDIGLIQVIGEDGNMTDNAGKEYTGLTIEEARKKVVVWLEKSGLLEKAEDTMQNVGTSDRFGDVVEPLPKTQWFIEVNKKFKIKDSNLKTIKKGQLVTLKQLMQTVVKTGDIKIIPERFDKTYFHWIDNLRDWNISRQIWYGHQIPVWYKGDEITVGTKPEGSEWTQDPDTLDTWFSSGSWTFSTLGWPKETDDLKKFHPTSVLETGYDILFFWVARMILMSTYALGEVPFKTVYLHGLVRDEEGRKMSKSLGNIIDPLDMIQKYGTDATRLSLLIGGTPGNDMRLSEEKIAGFRNFTNKLWNISRFMLLNIESPRKDVKKPKAQTAADEWILWKLNAVVLQMNESFTSYQFSLAGETLRDFTWGELADWYLEIAKVEGEKSEILNYILNTILKLWHPFMPFVTEQVWQEIYDGPSLMMEEYPKAEKGKKETGNVVFIDITLRNVITKIRSIRTEYKIEPAKKIVVSMRTKDVTNMLTEYIPVFTRLAGLETITHEKIEKAVSFTESGIEVDIDLSSAIDTTKEKARIEKEIASVEPYVIQMEKKLSNKEFVQNAPQAVVEKEQQKLEEGKQKLQTLQSQLKSFNL